MILGRPPMHEGFPPTADESRGVLVHATNPSFDVPLPGGVSRGAGVGEYAPRVEVRWVVREIPPVQVLAVDRRLVAFSAQDCLDGRILIQGTLVPFGIDGETVVVGVSTGKDRGPRGTAHRSGRERVCERLSTVLNKPADRGHDLQRALEALVVRDDHHHVGRSWTWAFIVLRPERAGAPRCNQRHEGDEPCQPASSAGACTARRGRRMSNELCQDIHVACLPNGVLDT
jgi:hypothetical protein